MNDDRLVVEIGAGVKISAYTPEEQAKRSKAFGPIPGWDGREYALNPACPLARGMIYPCRTN